MIQRITGRWFTQLELLFEPRDVWIGLYWKRYPSAIEFYLCVLPLLPIRLYVQDMRSVQPQKSPHEDPR